MSKGQSEILKKLREHTRQEPVIIPATVKTVNESENTCIIEVNGLEYPCRLNAAQGSIKGILIVPAVNSTVLAMRIDETGDQYVMHAFTDIDKIILREGQNGGLVIVSDLVSQMNKIEQDLNNLKQVFTAWTPVPSDGGAALKAASATWAAQNIAQTTNNDIEDETILH